MSRLPIPKALRRLVIERARGLCEYCLIHTHDAIIPHQIDHVIAVKHGGLAVLWNLALACVECNLHKGTDLATIDWQTGQIIPLFNPRQQRWAEHFSHNGASIIGVTPIGIVTVALMQLNRVDRVEFRQLLLEADVYPPAQIIQG